MNPKEELPVRTAACTALGLVIQQDQSNQDKLRNTKGAIESLVGPHSSCAPPPRVALWSSAASHGIRSLVLTRVLNVCVGRLDGDTG